MPTVLRVLFYFFSIHTDIPFGNSRRATTVLVLSGVSSLADVEKEQKQNTEEGNLKIPDYHIESLTKFYDLIVNESWQNTCFLASALKY